MNDSVNRQMAINAICKACSMEEDYHKCDGYPETSTWCDELVALRALPSTSLEIIRCKNCKYYLSPHGCGHIDGMVTSQEDGFCSYAKRK